MASPQMISSLLDKLAAAFGKPASWSSTMVPIWAQNFAKTDDRQLAQAVSDLIGTEEWCPKPATIHKRLKEVEKSSPRTTMTLGCGDCVGGWRRVVRHVETTIPRWVRQDGRRVQDGVETRIVKDERAARCGCLRGQVVGTGKDTPLIPSVGELVNAWRSSPSTLGGMVWIDPDPAEVRTAEEHRRVVESGVQGRWAASATLRDQGRDDYRGARERSFREVREWEADDLGEGEDCR